jgi:predicted hydrocarbon binding protein
MPSRGGVVMLEFIILLVVVRVVLPLAYELGKAYGMKWIEKHFDDDEK